MASITLRAVKGTPLTNAEVDNNFSNLNTAKYEAGDSPNFVDTLTDKLSLDITATPGVLGTGQMAWNPDDGTADLGLNGGATILQIGQEIHYRVINQTGSTIPDGTLCMYDGTVGASGKVKVKPWTGTGPSLLIMGIATADIPTEGGTETGLGYVTSFGKVRGIDTTGAPYGETWANGDVLYAGPTGGLTKVRPQAPKTKTVVAAVVTAHASVGTLLVRVTPSSSIENDDEVELTSITNGDVLIWNGTAGRFENKTQANLFPSQTSQSGKFLTTNGTAISWANVPSPNNGTLTLGVSGTGLTGSATFTADQAGNSTFTVTSNATSANTAGAIVARDGSGNFVAGTITAALSGNATTATTLQTARTINGVSFNGSANITITANTTNTLTLGTGLTGTSFNGSAAVTAAVSYGTTSGTACQGNDSRLSDARQATNTNTQLASLGVGTPASGTAGEIRATNNITAYYSDDRLKTKLGNIEDALGKVRSLSGFYYEANDVAQALGYDVKREVGVSAQQVQAVQPEVVAPAPIDEKYLTVRYERLVPLLIEAIKQLDTEVQSLKAQLKG